MLTQEQKKKIEEEEKYRSEVIASPQIVQQKHGVPAILSLLLPGLGQIVKGQTGRGILIFIGFVVGLMLLFIPGIIVYIWQVSDAYNN